MNIFHKHDWKEIARTYAPPISCDINSQGVDFDLDRLLLGVTTILWECTDKDCQETRKEELLGSIIKQSP